MYYTVPTICAEAICMLTLNKELLWIGNYRNISNLRPSKSIDAWVGFHILIKELLDDYNMLFIMCEGVWCFLEVSDLPCIHIDCIAQIMAITSSIFRKCQTYLWCTHTVVVGCQMFLDEWQPLVKIWCY